VRSRLLAISVLLSVGAVAGCGSSNSDTANIVPAPSAAQTLTAPAPVSAIPTSGPLSVEPTIAKPTTPAPTTLSKTDLIVGKGAVAADGDTLEVDYLGALYSTGKVFAGGSSWSNGKGQGFSFKLGGTPSAVIPGWEEGLVGMRVGGRRELIIPPSLAYGATAQSSIPANSTLIFVVDLLRVTPPA
jgi:peptidylprolyl isomerase